MTRLLVAILVVSLVASCGGRRAGQAGGTVTRVASGPISSACMKSGRKEATAFKCGCAQAVANQSLSSREQRRGAAFFKDPHKAQETRQSSSASGDDFWRRWKAFGDAAAKQCA